MPPARPPWQTPIRIELNYTGTHTGTDFRQVDGTRAGQSDGIKFLQNGQIYIRRDGVTYDVLGRKAALRAE